MPPTMPKHRAGGQLGPPTSERKQYLEKVPRGVSCMVDSALSTEGFEFWSLDVNGGDEWKVEDLSKDQRKEFPNDQVKKYFVTSY